MKLRINRIMPTLAAFMLCLCALGILEMSIGTGAPNLNAQTQEKVFVPSARLVFRALDSLSKSQVSWKGLSSYSKTSTYNSRYLISLNLGSRVSDAFVASQAKDDNNFLQMALTMSELSAKLGVDIDASLNQKMLDLVKASNWTEVRTILDKQQEETKRKLNRLDRDASVLVVVGGWLEGLHVTAKALSNNYNAGATSILANPKLIDYLISELGNVSQGAKNNSTVRKLSPQLSELKNLVNVEKGKPIPQESVKKIVSISGALIKEVENSKD
jgi:hypothetical protein